MVPIEKSAVKIVVFNNFKAMRVEFTNTNNNFCMEVIHSGVSSLCICNYEWTNWLAKNDVYMLSINPYIDKAHYRAHLPV